MLFFMCRVGTVCSPICRPLRRCPTYCSCSRLHRPKTLSRVLGGFDEPFFLWQKRVFIQVTLSHAKQKTDLLVGANIFMCFSVTGGYGVLSNLSTTAAVPDILFVLPTSPSQNAIARFGRLRRTFFPLAKKSFHPSNPLPRKTKNRPVGRFLFWWERVDSNHRS